VHATLSLEPSHGLPDLALRQPLDHRPIRNAQDEQPMVADTTTSDVRLL
jgi:hypothetical protein